MHQCVNERLNNLTARTGYSLIQTNGQRVYAAPDANCPPRKGCEVFVGNLPRNLFEDGLANMFEQVGPIFQIRLMMDFRGFNRGYGFVSYYHPKVASLAVKYFHGAEFVPGRRIGVYKSIDNCRLFVGGIPPEKTKAEVESVILQYMFGVKEIVMYQSVSNRDRNRGFLFIEFTEHKLAALARRRLPPGSLFVWGVPILVDWADPLPIVDEEIMSKVKILFMRNLKVDMTVSELTAHIVDIVPSGAIIKVHKTQDYAFVHFITRYAAEMALKDLQGMTIDGDSIEVIWARPRFYSKKNRNLQPPHHFCTSLPSRMRKEIRSYRDERLAALNHRFPCDGISPNLGPLNRNCHSFVDAHFRNVMPIMPSRMQQPAPFNATLKFLAREPFYSPTVNMPAFNPMIYHWKTPHY